MILIDGLRGIPSGLVMHMANHVDGGNLRLYVSSETEFFFVSFVEFPSLNQ